MYELWYKDKMRKRSFHELQVTMEKNISMYNE